MMKQFLLFCMSSIAVFLLQAQKVNYGLNLGANLTSINGNGLKRSLSSGFQAGAFSRIHLNKKWDLQPEVNFNYTNTSKADNFLTYYVNSGYENATTKVHLSYISVPVLLGYKIDQFFTINFGPQYSLLAYENDNLVKNNQSAFTRNDLGIAVGGQLRLENLNFYARYVMGVLNINNIDERYKWYNRQIQMGVNLQLF